MQGDFYPAFPSIDITHHKDEKGNLVVIYKTYVKFAADDPLGFEPYVSEVKMFRTYGSDAHKLQSALDVTDLVNLIVTHIMHRGKEPGYFINEEFNLRERGCKVHVNDIPLKVTGIKEFTPTIVYL